MTPLLALLLISIRDALLTLMLCYHVTCLSTLITNTSSSHTHHSELCEKFYCRNGVLARNIINTASTPHQRFQHPTKDALLLAPSNGLATFLALLLITIRHHLLTTYSRPPSQLLTRHLGESYHLLALSKSVYHSKCCHTTSCASPMLMHFSRLPCIYQVFFF